MVNEVSVNITIQHSPPVVSNAPAKAPVKEVLVVKPSVEWQKSTASGNLAPAKIPQNDPATMDAMQDAMRQLQDYAQNMKRNLDFRIDEESGRTVITVIDSETDEVVRQIPSEEILVIARHLAREQEGGFLVRAEV